MPRTAAADSRGPGPAGAPPHAPGALPGAARGGERLALTITAVDAHGNVVTGYTGSASVTSTDPSDRLPAAGGFTNGVRNVALAFVTVGSHFATANEVFGSIHVNTSTVNIVSADAVVLLVSGGAATPGSPAATPLTA